MRGRQSCWQVCRRLAVVAVWRGHQLFGLGNSSTGVQGVEDGLNALGQPYVEVIGQVGVADVVVVRRVGGD